MKRMMIAAFVVMMATSVGLAQEAVTEYPADDATVQPIPADSYGGYDSGIVEGSVGGGSCGCNGGGTIAAAPMVDGGYASDCGCGCGTTTYDYGCGDCCPTYSSHGRMFGGMGFRGMFSRNRCCCY